MNIQLLQFWSTWSGSRGQDLASVAHVLAWHLGVIIAIVEPLSINSKSAWPLFLLELLNILENNGLQ